MPVGMAPSQDAARGDEAPPEHDRICGGGRYAGAGSSGSGDGSGAGPGSGSIGVAGSFGAGTVAGSSGAPGVPGSGTAGVVGASGTAGVAGMFGWGTSSPDSSIVLGLPDGRSDSLSTGR